MFQVHVIEGCLPGPKFDSACIWPENPRWRSCLPGGKHDAGDSSLWQTALRETREEISLAPEAVTCQIRLDDVRRDGGITGRGYELQN